ncbi:hypothetical protein MGYG_07406 [Nannizzia gypsea CBS 118893]|uniref:Calponin-homology (CH) domain-containing protein n=1 Tax=Arthroderma gypseum (strain ATCC MYA-4604 / CBS 118893) TaxID=535722 RepID=E4V326_ARTGP|nr:hypothetical protein MGYG_07406 [Nannizzia gypsea CBS 118893]EFR04400.1 hypothetical protein MGYG_07406 [Nannizzia gypsea CBS 118893]
MEYHYLDATPCPVTWNRNDAKIPILEDILDSYDDTADIDFMAELGSLNSLAREKLRRARTATAFKIHEDAGSSGDSHGGRKTLCRESSMFSQPAQRFPRSARAPVGRLSSPKMPMKKQLDQFKENPLDENPRPVKSPHAMQKPVKEQKTKKEGRSIRDKRRNTIYIPPEDDTTMATIFMDAFSPLKTQDFGCQELSYIEAQILKKRKQQKPKSPAHQRQPLEVPSRIMQESVDQPDVMGKNTGKENVPPGKLEGSIAEVTGKEDALVGSSAQPMKLRSVNSPRPRPSLSKQKPLESKPPVSRATHGRSSVRRITFQDIRNPQASLATKQRKESKEEDLPLNTTLSLNPIPKRKSPSELLLSLPSAPKIEIKYPALLVNLADPLLHEETWLSHQEAVITQLVNTLLDTANGQCSTQGQNRLKQQLFDLYQDTYFTLLSKRVQASLLYGDLRATEDPTGRRRRLTTDARLRRAFRKFWTDTYDIFALQAAAEVVIGKEVGHSFHGGNLSANPQISIHEEDKEASRAVELFLDAMLIKNEDMSQDASTKPSECGDVVKGYHRTAFRSIMIIALLDKARMAPDTALPRNLFKLDSEYTSSAAVMRALGPVLLHPQTDITRPLARLDCSLVYKQHSLGEYNYHINNIAVDIRDGVILTRLTELLLLEHFPERFHTKEKEGRPLSGQLRMPCISRANKVHNARVTLSALAKDFPSIGATIGGIKPEDIVDGYREKTIALLWIIVAKWGLSTLVDWDDLKGEIVRLEKKISRLARKETSLPPCHEQAIMTDTAGCHSSLLHRWASCLARLRGLEVSNLTTSLADGRVFMSILDEYEQFIRPTDGSIKADTMEASTTTPPPSKARTSSSTSNESALKRRLLALGCSSQFALISQRSTSPSSSLISAAQAPPSSSTHTHTTTEEDSNMTALAFLSSRLLSASKYGRAAVTIQRAWRHMLATRPVIDGQQKR